MYTLYILTLLTLLAEEEKGGTAGFTVELGHHPAGVSTPSGYPRVET